MHFIFIYYVFLCILKQSYGTMQKTLDDVEALIAAAAEPPEDSSPCLNDTLTLTLTRQRTYQTKKTQEKRAARDGQLYTKEEFIEFYGGTAEWDAAAPAPTDVQHASTPPQDSSRKNLTIDVDC